MSDVEEVEGVADDVCEHCGTEMELVPLRPEVDQNEGTATIWSGYTCPNPDCPGHDTDMAKLTEGQS
ncbi:hypothetical protein ACOCJ7_07110 [Knoellia sp. CPCC 206453]|uniref:hypothetical protein n=1 Tax=Knoellia pratensis TaxID=3404796 RepID=UPI0036204564